MENVTGLILVVDDEAAIRQALSRMLARQGHTVVEAETLDQARGLLTSESVDLAIIDWHLNGESGMDLIKFLKRNDPSVESILMTA